MNNETPTRKSSSVRHTRAIQRDHTKRPVTTPSDEQIRERLTEIVQPATLAQVGYFHGLGLRERTLNLPVMVAFILELIWRQISGICELARIVQDEAVLWTTPMRVSQQALAQRLTSLPAELFLRVLLAIIPILQQRWAKRQRPLPPEIAWAQAHYSQVYVHDGSTLDALIRKIGLLQDLPNNPLAGRMTALLNLCSRLPVQLWYAADPQAHDQRCWPQILSVLRRGALLIFDMGYTSFAVFAQLTLAQIKFITRAKRNLVYTLDRTLVHSAAVRDELVWIGKGLDRQLVRLVQALYRGQWYRYLTNECDAERLPTAYVVALYWQRWRIEDAYAIVKRLLGLAYFWSGSQNAIEMQVWATWLLYAVLVDLSDAVAEALNQPFATISVEMVYRSLYFFTQARQRGAATDVVAYLAANAKRLGIIKRKRKSAKLPALVIIASLTNPGSP